jgi:hypothetical protein
LADKEVKKEKGKRKKEEGRRKKEEGRRKEGGQKKHPFFTHNSSL